MYQALRSSSTPTREKCLLFSKVSKKVGQLATKIAALEQENQLPKRRYEEQETFRPRKRTAIDPNDQFLGILDIQAALQKEREKEAENERQGHAETVSQEAQRQGFKSMCFQWQL